jgi:hypothetical protein
MSSMPSLELARIVVPSDEYLEPTPAGPPRSEAVVVFGQWATEWNPYPEDQE